MERDDHMLSPEAIEGICARLKAGETVEESKLDIKQAWPALKTMDGKDNRSQRMEFLKDLVAMANTPGPTGHIVYGVAKDGTLHDAPFGSCGLRDESQLHGLVVRYVTPPPRCEVRPLEMEHGVVSVLEVPPSLSKPHFIGLYETPSGQTRENYVPIRHLTSINPANPSDFEHMIYDRKNIEPDYALEAFLAQAPVFIRMRDAAHLDLDITLALMNHGRRPVAIMSSALHLGSELSEDMRSDTGFPCFAYFLESKAVQSVQDIRYLPIVVPANGVVTASPVYRIRKDSALLPRLEDDARNRAAFEFTLSFTGLGGYSYRTDDLRGSLAK
jgi:hypothetical protein